MHLKTSAYTVAGEGFAGVPYVILGHNNWVTWGMTVNPIDCTDVFQEQVVPDAASPSGLSTLYLGALEPILPLPVVFRANLVGDGILDDVVVINDPLLNIPLAGGAWLPPLAGLEGLPVDGGEASLDVGSHALRADSADEFMFSAGASRRFVASLAAIPRAQSSLPGGASGNVFSPSYTNLLPDWLTNETYQVRYTPADLAGHVASTQVFVP